MGDGNEEVKETPARDRLLAEQREALGGAVGLRRARTTHPPALCLNRHGWRARGSASGDPHDTSAVPGPTPRQDYKGAGPIAPPATQTTWGSFQILGRRRGGVCT